MKQLFFGLMLVLAACDQRSRRSQGIIHANPSTLDFGTPEPGSVMTGAVMLSNDGQANIEISHVAIENDGRKAFSVSDVPTVLAAGASATLTVRYTAPTQEGPDGARLVIDTDADNSAEVAVSLTGRVVRACTPKTCFGEGWQCGPASDGCASTLDCGTCPSTQVCNANACCAPETDAALCVRLGKSCGRVTATDNCGTARTVASCGTCECAPELDSVFCARVGKNCGTVSGPDNCGTARTVPSCGTCTAPQTCMSNLCGCTAENDAAFCTRLGKNCGTLTAADNCGVTRTVASCGTCTLPQTCPASNVCACVPDSDATLCMRAGKNCGSINVTDNCGAARVAVCGSCTLPQLCGGGGVTQVCGTCGSNCWAAMAPLTLPVSSRAMTAVGTQVILAEGGLPNGHTWNVIETYDTGTNTWRLRLASPASRTNARGVAVNGKAYFIGGCAYADCGSIGISGAVAIYDPVATTVTTGAPMPTARFNVTLGTSGNKIYAVGGTTACPPCNRVPTVEIYDTTTNTWTAGPALPVPRSEAAGAVIGNLLYAIAGSDASALVTRNDAMDLGTNTWTTRAPILNAHASAGGAVLGGRVYVTGGGNSAEHHAYDPATDSWSLKAPAPVAKVQATTTATGGVLFLIGPETADGGSNRLDAYWP